MSKNFFDALKPATWFNKIKLPFNKEIHVHFEMKSSLNVPTNSVVIEQIIDFVSPEPSVLRLYWPSNIDYDVALSLTENMVNHWLIHAKQEPDYVSFQSNISSTAFVRMVPVDTKRKIQWCGILSFSYQGIDYSIPCEWVLHQGHMANLTSTDMLQFEVDHNYIIQEQNYLSKIYSKQSYLGTSILELIPDISDAIIKVMRWGVSYSIYYPNKLFNIVSANKINITKNNGKAYIDFILNERHDNNVINSKNSFLNNIKEQKMSGHFIFFNVKRFKLINEALGIFSADSILHQLKIRLQNIYGTQNVINWYGDRFLIFVPELDSMDISINSILLEKFSHLEQEFVMSYGIVYTYFSIDDLSYLEDIVHHLENELDNLKEGEKNTFHKITHYHDFKAFPIHIESDLLEAVKNDELYLMYQPIVTLHDGAMIGAEALVRWRHPIQGIINPDNFIPLAEESGLIDPLTSWVFEHACTEAHTVLNSQSFMLSINISPSQFSRIDFIDHVDAVIQKLELKTCQIKLELTETLAMSDDLKNKERFKILKDKGFQIAVDDFGTGQAGFHYLKNTDVDTIKFDKSLIKDIHLDSTQKLLQALISLIHSVDMKVLAEGIETLEEANLLKELGCDYGQGYFFGRPMPFKDLFN